MFIVTVSMNVFGVGVIRDFGFALNVGAIACTYATIFVSSPVLLWIARARTQPGERSSFD